MKMQFHKIDKDHISVKGRTDESEWSRTTEPTEEDKKNALIVH